MKALNLIIALLLCTQAYGQDFDLKDLLAINSEETFKRFTFEKGFVFEESIKENLLNEEQYTLKYKYERRNYSNQTNEKIAEATYLNYEEKYWIIGLSDDKWESSNRTFEKVIQQAKSNCEFKGFRFSGLEEYACYKCPNSKFKGELGFSRSSSDKYKYYIKLVTPY